MPDGPGSTGARGGSHASVERPIRAEFRLCGRYAALMVEESDAGEIETYSVEEAAKVLELARIGG